MTFWGRTISFFPLLHMILVIGTAWLNYWLIPLALYVFPVLIFRLHHRLAALSEGKSRLDLPHYSPWWTSYNLQTLFHALPSLEAILRLIPGVYSFWLRCWGSSIGRGVTWTPGVEITDRSLLEIGDRVIFGHKVILVSHAISKKKSGAIWLYVKKIRIGSDSFIGAGSQFGPGTTIAPNQRVPLQTQLRINQNYDQRTDC
jgi:hypothetical protein